MRFAGQAVALVLAGSRYAAEDALERGRELLGQPGDESNELFDSLGGAVA